MEREGTRAKHRVGDDRVFFCALICAYIRTCVPEHSAMCMKDNVREFGSYGFIFDAGDEMLLPLGVSARTECMMSARFVT